MGMGWDGAFKGTDAVDSWYSEVKNYDYKRGNKRGTGHFTQLVWVASRKLGLGVAKRNGKVFVVANFDPAGNVIGAFQENVLEPRN